MATQIVDSKTAARILGITHRRVRKLCAKGYVAGVQLVSGSWLILAKIGAKKRAEIKVNRPDAMR